MALSLRFASCLNGLGGIVCRVVIMAETTSCNGGGRFHQYGKGASVFLEGTEFRAFYDCI